MARPTEADDAEYYVSVASVWEMAVKISLGKLRVPYDLREDLPRLLADGGFGVLPLGLRHMQVAAWLGPRQDIDVRLLHLM